jgi:hypothetical protein
MESFESVTLVGIKGLAQNMGYLFDLGIRFRELFFLHWNP